MNTQFDLSNRTILVTGASSGIGRSCALRAAESGARVIAVSRSLAGLTTLVGVDETDCHSVDLLDEVAVKDFVKLLKTNGIQLSGCVLAAGLHSFRPVMMEGFGDVAKPWAINLQSSLATIGMLVRSRLFVKPSSIVLFSSAAAQTGSPGAVSYAASKGAVEGATRTLALELAGMGIRTNAVAPGVVSTPMSEAFLAKLSAEQLASIDAHHPMGRGTPEDVSGPVMFLLSDEARWVNGVILPVDGGYSVAGVGQSIIRNLDCCRL